MKNVWLCLLIVACLCCMVGCEDPTDARHKAADAHNETELKSGGTLIGTLPDGREVRCYAIHLKSGRSCRDHWVYVVGNTQTVNYSETHGKSQTTHHVQATIEP
jgi:hypothetical protein